MNYIKTAGPVLLVCFGFGMLFASALLALIPGITKEAHDAIELCEAELPRNQTCIIIAIPNEKNK